VLPLAVAWRVPVGARAGRPCEATNGWVVADAAGGVAKISAEGHVLWRVSFSNEAFAGASEIAGGRVAVASESGRVFGLDGATGAELWLRAADARFQHAPLVGRRGAESVLWLVSQEDGRLFCLRASDGTVVWMAEATNRCDGEPAAWPGRIAYGNCDGAVYVFDAFDGKLLGKVEVGAEDQMAGGIRVLADGRLATGTRSGKLVLVDPEALTCVASVKVSESEAFVTPAACFMSQVAMGSEEGAVTLWFLGAKEWGSPSVRFATGAAVKSLESAKERLFALAGGTLFCFDQSRETGKIALGDEVGGLAVNAAGEVVCVADGALVCVKGGVR
jgi:outer membrane protein assembly factor BamB